MTAVGTEDLFSDRWAQHHPVVLLQGSRAAVGWYMWSWGFMLFMKWDRRLVYWTGYIKFILLILLLFVFVGQCREDKPKTKPYCVYSTYVYNCVYIYILYTRVNRNKLMSRQQKNAFHWHSDDVEAAAIVTDTLNLAVWTLPSQNNAVTRSPVFISDVGHFKCISKDWYPLVIQCGWEIPKLNGHFEDLNEPCFSHVRLPEGKITIIPGISTTITASCTNDGYPL